VIRLIYADTSDPLDGIRRYAELCRDALRTREGLDVDIELWTRDEPARPAAGDVLVLQYNPFSYGRRGFAPWLVRRMRHLRAATESGRFVLMLHEAYVPPRSVRWALMGAWQRLQLAALGRLCDAVIVSTEAWRDRAERVIPRTPIHHVPVGSNLPEKRDLRPSVRAAHGWTDETVVIATFGADPASRLDDLVLAAADQVSRVRQDTVIAQLGKSWIAPAAFSPGVNMHSPGVQDSDDAAAELSAVDVFLAPYEDGVSARRTTLAAALQHGIATVGTLGRNTDSYLAQDARLTLVKPSDVEGFADAVARLAADEDTRRERALAARSLFEERFSWGAIAQQLSAVFQSV
jgi:glycosyltransferase involved in cell wall biosynthesis